MSSVRDILGADLLTPETLRRVGLALYGRSFVTELAADLGVTRRTVRRWLDDDYPIPPEREQIVIATLMTRSAALANLAAEMASQKKSTDPKKVA